MRIFTLTTIIILSSQFGFAQWTTGTNIYNTNTGNVGIGTATPSEKLVVNGNISIPLLNSVGFGQSDKFTYDSKTFGNYTLGWYMDSGNTGAPSSYYSAYGGIRFFTQGLQRVMIAQNGNMGIGTTTTGSFKLAVEGKIGAREVNVLTGAWPDYVFETSYKLPTLEDLNKYIQQNKHLPEVPSASIMEETGINLGEMNRLLLKKIEELTLYNIQQNEKIKILEERLNKVELKQR